MEEQTNRKIYIPRNWNKTMTWKKINVTRGNKEPLIFLSRGKAQYVRFSKSFMTLYKLEKKKYVDVFIDKTDKKILVGFAFKEDKGTLKLATNDVGAGFISGYTIFKEIYLNGTTKDKIDKVGKNGFQPEEDTHEGNRMFVIQIPTEKAI